VELPGNGASVSAGGSLGNVESVKATSDVNSPVSGEVNTKLTETPGLVSSPLTSDQSYTSPVQCLGMFCLLALRMLQCHETTRSTRVHTRTGG
jgi:hypothetical protein